METLGNKIKKSFKILFTASKIYMVFSVRKHLNLSFLIKIKTKQNKFIALHLLCL